MLRQMLCSTIFNCWMKKLRSEMHFNGFKTKWSRCLEVHCSIYRCPQSNQQLMIVHWKPVCLKAWRLIFNNSKRTFNSYRADSKENKVAQMYGNVGKHQQRLATLKAISTMRMVLENKADMMPYKTRTLQRREKVDEKVLPMRSRWNHLLNDVNTESKHFIILHASYF